jgi:hypothetical protein
MEDRIDFDLKQMSSEVPRNSSVARSRITEMRELDLAVEFRSSNGTLVGPEVVEVGL